MKCLDSFVYGSVFGIMLMFIFAGWFPEEKQCQIKMSYGNGSVKVVTVGVIKGGV